MVSLAESRLRGTLSVSSRVCEEFGEAIGPAALEVDVLCVRDQERGIEVRQAQRDDEFLVADAPTDGMGDLNLVSDALFSHTMFCADKQDLACSVAEWRPPADVAQSCPPRSLSTSAQTS